MIPILFESTAKSFDNYGIGVLRDTTSCEITEERNGPYELTLKYPINGALYGYIKKERIIVAKPNDLAKNQAFRIYKISIPINGIITVCFINCIRRMSHESTVKFISLIHASTIYSCRISCKLRIICITFI